MAETTVRIHHQSFTMRYLLTRIMIWASVMACSKAPREPPRRGLGLSSDQTWLAIEPTQLLEIAADYGTTIKPYIAATMESSSSTTEASSLSAISLPRSGAYGRTTTMTCRLTLHSLRKLAEPAKTNPAPAGPALQVRSCGSKEEVVGGYKSCR